MVFFQHKAVRYSGTVNGRVPEDKGIAFLEPQNSEVLLSILLFRK